MKYHSQLSGANLKFDEILKEDEQDNILNTNLSILISEENTEIAKTAMSLKFSRNRNIFHSYADTSVINILFENKDREEEIIRKLHEKDDFGFNPSHLAIMRGDYSTLQNFLIKDPTLVFEKDSNGNSPLHLALMKNPDSSTLDNLFNLIIKSPVKSNLEESFQLISQYLDPTKRFVNTVMNSLLEKGVDINAINSDGNTALHLAVLNGNLEMVNFLLNHGAKFDIKDKNGKNALELIKDENQQKKLFSQTIESNNLELVKTLFEMGFKHDEADFLFKNAVNSNNLELIKFMVNDMGINTYEHDRITKANGYKNYNIENPVDYAISRALDFRSQSNEDFLSKQEAIIKFLLENGALPNKDSVDRDKYPNDLDKLPPYLKAHIEKYNNVLIMFIMSENVTRIEGVIDSFIGGGADLEKTQSINLLYYSGRETSASGESKLITTESEPIELTALGIINLYRHISFKGYHYNNANDDKVEELHKKIIESRSKLSLKEKLSDSTEITPSTSTDPRSLGAEQSSPPSKKSRT
jgi:ankyrin repeat protein